MLRSVFLATAALTFSSAMALAQGPAASANSHGAGAAVQLRHVARHDAAMAARPLYDYAPANAAQSHTLPLILGVAY